MHGRLKVKTSEEQLKEKLIEKEKKLKKFQLLCSDVFKNRKVEEFDSSLLARTSEVLISNPDLYTFWNVRKEILLKLKSDRPNEAEELLKKELNFLNDCLKSNPKSYGSWHHRCFVMENMNTPDWKGELGLCSKFLEVDDRNFHCWDYRRFVVKNSCEPLESELNFTTTKIKVDFSNFSSWHYRSELVSLLHSNHIGEPTLSRELSFVENAFFTDPNDQSSWFYHRWLLGTRRSVSIEGVHVDRKLGRTILRMTSPVQLGTNFSVDVKVNGDRKKLLWKTANGRKFCKMIVAELGHEDLERSLTNQFEFEVSDCSKKPRFVVCKMEPDELFLNYPTTSKCANHGRLPTQSILEKQFSSLKELHDLEPDNKWTLYALMLLMESIKEVNYYEDAIQCVYKLISLDPYRTNYYNDLMSRLKIGQKIRETNQDTRSVDLSRMSLTSVHFFEELCTTREIDLSYNSISSLDGVFYLQSLQSLILSHNRISQCTDIFSLEQLHTLDLSHNDIKSVDDLKLLSTCPKLKNLSLKGNPITLKSDYCELVKSELPNVRNVN